MTFLFRSNRVLVCGGRHYRDRDRVFEVLNVIHDKEPITTIIHGGSGERLKTSDVGTVTIGADLLADDWASEYYIQVHRFDAEWGKYGRAAGPIRNALMLSDGQPDLVVAFPGGRGTANMITLAVAKDVTVHFVAKREAKA